MNAKLKAFLIHLALSLLIFGGLFALLLFFWYPEPYFTASGGWQGLKIVAMVDIVLGPLLTLVVYNPAKPRRELLQDYSFIVLLQLAALGWGVYTVYQNRPVVAAWWDDRFYTVSYDSLASQDRYRHMLGQLLDQKIPLVVIPPPKSSAELADIMDVFFNQGIAPQQQLDRYRPLQEALALIRNRSLAKSELSSVTWFDKSPPPRTDDMLFFRLDSAYENLVLVTDRKGKLLGYSRIDESSP